MSIVYKTPLIVGFYKLCTQVNMNLLLLYPLLLLLLSCVNTTAKKTTNLRAKGAYYVTGNRRQYAGADPKDIIMEKYGKHYRLTGDSTLGTKRNKGDDVNGSIASLQNTSTSESGKADGNVSVSLVGQDKANSTDNTTVLHSNSSDASVTPDKNKTLEDVGVNATKPNANQTGLASETNLKNVSSSDLVNASQHINDTTASKSDINKKSEEVCWLSFLFFLPLL